MNMNRKNLLALVSAVMLSVPSVFAQCVIDNNNNTDGISPTTVPCIEQGTAYTQTVQLHVPTSVNGGAATVDSVLVTGITGMPAGITLTLNPAAPTKILGGGNGCIEIAGTTSAAVGNYPLTVSITAWAKIGGVTPIQQNTTLGALGYNFSLDVCAAQAQSCDTLINVAPTDTITYYVFNNNGGYVSGNNSYGDKAKAEKFTTTPGYKIEGAAFGIGEVSYTNASTQVTFSLWDDSGADGSPGNVLATQTVSIGLLDTVSNAQNPLIYIPFPTEPITTSGSFFAGVTLPTATGDTVVLYTTTQNSPTGAGWELWSDDTWVSYDSAYLPNPHFGNYVIAIACPNVANTNPPVADFTGTNLTGCATTTVQFTDASTNQPTAWAWSFGDGGTATTQNPSHTYAAAGSYNVTLIATNANGADTLVKTAYVTVTPAIAVSATATQAGCGQNNASVTTTTTGGTGTYVYDWSGSAQNTANLSNVGAGVYTVTVTSGACSATASATVTNAGSNLAVATSTTPATAANATDGTATATVTGGTDPYTYLWSNSATTATLPAVAPGTYSVTVTDASGCQAFGSVVVTFGTSISTANSAINFSVMPNPATTQLRFEFTSAFSGEGFVYSTDGKLFDTFAINNQVETLNISNLPSGVYVIHVKDRNTNATSYTRVVKY